MAHEGWPDPCREVNSAVHDYLDGQIDPRVEAAIAAHLQQCPPCQHLVGFEQAVRARVRQCCGCEVAPADLRVRIMTQVTRIQVTYREGGGPGSVER